MANSPRKTTDADKRSDQTSGTLQNPVPKQPKAKWGFCPICRQSVRRQGVRTKDGKRYNVIGTHWGGQEMCYGSDLPWEVEERSIEVVNNARKKKDRYKITIEEIPCNNQL